MDLILTSEIKVELVQQMGGDHMIVHAARVSTAGGSCREDVADADGGYGLIKYLMQHRHGTPFEHSAATFFVHAPIFVWREWHRHRIGHSYNEESARYKMLDPVFYVPPRGRPMMKVEGWKPGRPKFLGIDAWCESQTDHAYYQYPEPEDRAKNIYHQLIYGLKESYRLAYLTYTNTLELGIDPGLARACLPVGIYSSCWVTVNPRSLMSFLSLRTHEPSAKFVSYPLYEMEVAARAVEKLFKVGWPLTYQAFNECGRVGP